MEGVTDRVRHHGAAMGRRLFETLALRQLGRGRHHPAHVGRPLHEGLSLEPPEDQRAEPAAHALQGGAEDGGCHVFRLSTP
jgi:hypothetical protein